MRWGFNFVILNTLTQIFPVMKQLIRYIPVVLFAVLLSCNVRSDEQYFETRSVEGVSRLKISGAFNLRLSQSDLQELTIEGSADLADKLQIKQNGDLLELHLEEIGSSFFNKSDLKITLAVADLRELEFEGAGNIKTMDQLSLTDFRLLGNGVGNVELDLDAVNVDAELNFVGNIVLKGNVDVFRMENEGVGNINASQFRARHLDLNSSGIGNVSVHCDDELSLVVNGIGKVNYTGNPKIIREDINGIAKVSRNK